MELLMGLVSILAIVAIVVVGAGILAFLIHMVIGLLDNDRTTNAANNELLDYSQYKQLENAQSNTHEFDFEAINEAKAEEEKKLAENAKDDDDIFKLLEDEEDVNPEEMERKIVEAKTAPVKEEKPAPSTEEVVTTTTTTTTTTTETEDDDFELDNLLDEISNDVEEEVKAESTNEEAKMSEELESYSIDDILNNTAEQEEPEEELTETTTTTVEETEPETVYVPVQDEASKQEIESLRAKVSELNQKLNETTTRTVVTVDMTEEECLNRLAILEERLKTAKKDYKINLKEYRPLKKIMNELERNQVKLRRKDAVVAKQKIALYGVNNYVDIDKEKAQKLANELELLDGLRLSVQHCEEVIAANKDRYPILEHTNAILEEQIANIEADIETTKLTLEKIREREGRGGKK